MTKPKNKRGKVATIRDLDLEGKRVFVRVDFNLPHDEKGTITNDVRIRNTLPTLKYLLKQGTVLILASHHSKKGQSLKPAAARLGQLLKRPVTFLPEFWTEEALKTIREAKPGSVFMLENTRFHEGEKKNDPELARHFAKMADVYVNDAFGTAHRAHTSTVGVPGLLPGAIGFLMEREVEEIQKTLSKPERPFIAIIGGAKISTKLGMISRLLEKADTVLLGGGVANTFLKAWGVNVGKSLFDQTMVERSRSIFWEATRRHTAMLLPEDVKTAHAVLRNGVYNVHHCQVHPDHAIYDIGEKTQKLYREMILAAKTIVWNGPMGMFEDDDFRSGTETILEAVAKSKARSVIGGGDTIASIRDGRMRKGITHVSTGGGAMLELIEKGSLPAIEALTAPGK
jgi:phosphoglycerate kinase